MKINAVHLEHCCCDWTKPGAVRTGYLYKKSESKRTFHKRWFLLRDNLLFYFSHKRPSDPTPLGLIILEGCCVDKVDDLTFRLSFPGSGARNYLLTAKTEEDVDGWIEVLTVAGFDSMQYAIKELEKQLEELVNGKTPSEPGSSTADPNRCDEAYLVEKKQENPEGISNAAKRDYSPVEITLDSEKVLRTFLQLHRAYGDCIEKMMAERSKKE